MLHATARADELRRLINAADTAGEAGLRHPGWERMKLDFAEGA